MCLLALVDVCVCVCVCVCVFVYVLVQLQAKAQLEETFRMTLEEKDEKISVMHTQVLYMCMYNVGNKWTF